MGKRSLLMLLALAPALLMLSPFVGEASRSDLAARVASDPLDYDVANGHFFTQTNGHPPGTDPTGYSVTSDEGVLFWDAFQQFGGQYVVGYPVTRRFIYDGFVTQAMQKMVFQWRPERDEVWFLNTFDALHDKGMDD